MFWMLYAQISLCCYHLHLKPVLASMLHSTRKAPTPGNKLAQRSQKSTQSMSPTGLSSTAT